MLEGPSKWLTQMIYIKHDRVKNPNWQDSIRWPIHYHRWGVKLGTKRSGRNLDQSYWMRVQRSYRSTKLPASRGGGGREKRERLEGEKKRVPFSPSVSPLPLPLPLPFCPCRAGYNCLYMSDIVPPMNSWLLLSRTGFINRSVVAQLLSILWSPLFLKRLYIQWSILCPVNHPNKKKLLLHCMDSLMPRSCQCSLPISRYLSYFLCYDRARQSFRIIDKSLDWLALL